MIVDMECRAVFLLLVVGVTLPWANPQDDHVDGHDSDNTNALRVRQAKKILLAGATFERKVQVDKDQEKAQSERDSHSKNRGKKPN